MATIVRYVNTGSSAGGDGTTNATSGANRAYATLSAAETALRQNLTGVGSLDVADPDGNFTVALCINCTGTAADTTAVTFTNASWVTDSTHKIMVRLEPGSAAAGPKWETGIYRLSAAPGYQVGTFSIGKALNLVLWNMQIECTSTLDNAPRSLQVGNFVVGLDIVGGFFRSTSTSGTWDQAFGANVSGAAGSTTRIRNATFVAADGPALTTENYAGTGTGIVYNCTVINRSTNVRAALDLTNWDQPSGHVVRLKNLLIQSSAGVNYNVVGTPTEALTILTQDTSAPGTGLDSKTATFVDSANWDYHLAAGDTVSKDVGTNLSGDANWPFSVDGDGVTRAGTWDVGADEYASSYSPPVLPFVTVQFR